MVSIDGRGDSKSLIRARGLGKTYRRGGEEIHVLQGLNLDVNAGDFVAFMGPSGSGKTTLLNLLGGLDVPSEGSVTVAGDEITRMSGAKLTAWRAPRRVRLPDVQPDPRAHGVPERRAASPAHEPVEGGPPPARRDRAGRGRARRPDAPLPAPALGWPGAARGRRARDRGRSDLSALRRADGRSRPQERRRDPGPARPPRPRSRQDRADSDA